MRGHYKVIVTPTAEPITLAEAKAHLRVDFTDDDSLITALIGAARATAEEFTNRAIMPQTLEHVLHMFPWCTPRNHFGSIRLFRSPYAALVSLEYYDADNQPQTLDEADLIIVGTSEPATICPQLDTQWPTVAERPDAITITYQAGYANAAAVPKPIKQAMLLMIGAWYERREDSAQNLPKASEMLLLPYVVREY